MICPCLAPSVSAGYVPKFGALKPGGFETISGTATVFASAYGASQYQITGGPLVNVAISGYARLSTVYNYTDLRGGWYRTAGPGGCVCPPHTTGLVPPTRPPEPGAMLGLSGDPLTGTQGEVSTYPLSAFCKQQMSSPGPGPSGGGREGASASRRCSTSAEACIRSRRPASSRC
jgi:hypothetical protein